MLDGEDPAKKAGAVETNIPQRLDSPQELPASQDGHRARYHVVTGRPRSHLGRIAREPFAGQKCLGLTGVEVGAIATGYLAGAVAGALFFGWLVDRLGRRSSF